MLLLESDAIESSSLDEEGGAKTFLKPTYRSAVSSIVTGSVEARLATTVVVDDEVEVLGDRKAGRVDDVIDGCLSEIS